MPLVNTRRMLSKAQSGGYAVGHFNSSNIEFSQAIIGAAQELGAPVILGTSVSALEFAGVREIYLVVKSLAEKARVPVALHLDHGPDVAWAKTCVQNGWTSVMIDTSKFEFAKNVALTKQVVSLAHRKKISVEAELGRLKGVEDIVRVTEREALLTDPQDARKFVDLTRVDSLAVAIGESHGAFKFKGEPKLDIRRLSEIRDVVNVPLVLHGSSSVYPDWVAKADKFGAKLEGVRGVPDSIIKNCIRHGICKVNTDTDLRIAFIAGIREFLSEQPKSIDYREALAAGRESVKQVVIKKISVFGSKGKA
ncbi:MAG: class II fructose-bisphosphate aldolase [Nanoarchaeota archaeon]